MMIVEVCPECGRNNWDTSGLYCLSCGYTRIIHTCIKCGHSWKGKEVKCPSCGYKPEVFRPDILDTNAEVQYEDSLPDLFTCLRAFQLQLESFLDDKSLSSTVKVELSHLMNILNRLVEVIDKIRRE